MNMAAHDSGSGMIRAAATRRYGWSFGWVASPLVYGLHWCREALDKSNLRGALQKLKLAADSFAAIGAPCVELHTGTFCNARGAAARRELKRLVSGARYAQAIGLQVNAGHGINLDNLAAVLQIPFLDTLNIGHSIVARSVFVGLDGAVHEMLAAMAKYRPQP